MRTEFVKVLLFICTVAVVADVALARPASAQGSVAYAHVRGDGTLDIANSKNVVAMGGGNGGFCFKLRFRPKNAVATIANDPSAPNQGLGFITVALPPTPMFTCPTVPNADAVVSTFDETAIGGGKSAGGHAFYVYWTK
jgi:hypothetical protein